MSPAISRWRLAAAFFAIYIIWGSSYIGIRFAIESLPPFFMAGCRFTLAGGLLIAWSRLRGTPAPNWANWRAAFLIGAILFLLSNGLLVWSERIIPSGMTALIYATIPLWMVLLDWLRPSGAVRPGWPVFAGLGLGLIGIAMLVNPSKLGGSDGLNPLGVLALLLGGFIWAAGSIYSRHLPLPRSPVLSTGMQLFAGGVLLFLLAGLSGEIASLQWNTILPRSIISVIYLAIFGSIIGYTSYVWLLQVSTPARVGTYAYVNPIVAVILGWAMAGEEVTLRTLLAAAIIISAVVIVVAYRGRGNPAKPAVVQGETAAISESSA
jgi:drug/metabolite transporter (DMT)-like permease